MASGDTPGLESAPPSGLAKSNPKGGKRIHVFTSDVLPFPGRAHSAGSVRSMQVIAALRQAGHHVTFSMPLIGYLSMNKRDQLLSHLTPEELWCSENYFQPEVVVNHVQPDCVIYCNVNTFRPFRSYARDVVEILDMNGALQLEGFLLDNPDTATAIKDGDRLQKACRQLVDRLGWADYLVTVSERQKYFWSAYASLAGYSLQDLDVMLCPPSIDIPVYSRKPSPKLSIVYAGGFYPWQNPDRFLRVTAQLLEKIKGAELHIYGAAHAGLPNEDSVKALIEELQGYRCVKYYGYRPIEELREKLSTVWCAVELMEQNIERELALTGRTIEFLSMGTPVIYNNFSTFSRLIESYNAGWTLPTDDTSKIEKVIDEMVAGGPELIEKLSRNAYRLAQAEFDPGKNFAPLLKLCAGLPEKRSSRNRVKARRNSKDSAKSPTPTMGRVLGIVPGVTALLDLRLGNPLRALQRQGCIEGFSIATAPFENLKNDSKEYESIVIQRSMPEAFYRALVNSGVRFLLDVDDNLLAKAGFRNDGPEKSLVKGLDCCSALTTPNPRLVKLLEQYSGVRLAQKAYITPNALPYPADLRQSSQPTQIVWIQSDISALTSSRDDVIRAVEQFSKRHQLPIVLIGRNVLERPLFTHQVMMGEIDFNANLQFLEFAPTSIGVAPLETKADQETLDFIAGKSDLKILLFDGYGHPGVFSNSPPYGDSSLRGRARLIENGYPDWMEALEYQYRDGWRSIAENSREIRAERHIDRISRESWAPALESVRLARPIRGKDIFEIVRNADMADQPISRLAYLAGNHDVAFGYVDMGRSSWDHFQEHGRLEGRRLTHDPGALNDLVSRLERESAELMSRIERRMGQTVSSPPPEPSTSGSEVPLAQLRQEIMELRSSYSWKITEPLRMLAKLFIPKHRR